MVINNFITTIDTNNVYHGTLHILFRHFDDFETLVPKLKGQFNDLPKTLKELAESYARSETFKSKTKALNDLKTKLHLYKRNFALKNAQCLLNEYIYSIIESGSTNVQLLKNDRLCLNFKLDERRTLKIVLDSPDYQHSKAVHKKPVRAIITSYVATPRFA